MTRRRKAPVVDLAEILNRPVRVKVDGETIKMSPFEAELEQCVVKALNGDIVACGRFLRWCLREGLIVKPPPEEDHESRVVVPKDWNWNEFMKLYDRFGPPPWSGERDGLTVDDREQRRALKNRRPKS